VRADCGRRYSFDIPSGGDHVEDVNRHQPLPEVQTRTKFFALGLILAILAGGGCRTTPRPGTITERRGDEIVVAGKFVHTGARVVLWMDPGGYDAYRVERRFSALTNAGFEASRAEVKDLDSPNRYNLRREGLTDEELEQVRGGGWDLSTLQRVVSQFVIHYDVCGTSRQCFKVLHDLRCLSVHFMLDLDGTIYQTLDVKERAWHAGTANSKSVGIEIANMGAYGNAEKSPFEQWYARDASGRTRITIPERFGDGGIRTKNFIGRPARPDAVKGVVQGRELTQYDYTPQQYEALARLTAALCNTLPRIECDYPRDAAGRLVPQKLSDEQLQNYGGLLGHFHITTNKVDPGPAFQWDHLVARARRLMHGGFTLPAHETSKGHLARE